MQQVNDCTRTRNGTRINGFKTGAELMSNLQRLCKSRISTEALKFGTVGLLSFLVDFGIFNSLRSTWVFNTNSWPQTYFGATIISVTLSTICAWIGNRYWTFRDNRRRNFSFELLEFAAVALLGLTTNLLCVWTSHEVLGLKNQFADNISRYIVGLALATILRFLLYRFWVYGDYRKDILAKNVKNPIQK